MNKNFADTIIAGIRNLTPFFAKFRDALWRLTSSDSNWIIAIIVLALLVRIPFIAYPPQTEFDEVIYADFTLHMLHHEPPFDIHPPLARMLFTGLAETFGPPKVENIPMKPDQPFADFPYIPIRLFMALVGTGLALLIYGIGRSLGYSERMAGLSALFVVFDNALVVFSRVMLPDGLLIFLNFLSLFLALLAIRSQRKPLTTALYVFAGIASGLALSTKWVALATLATAELFFLSRKRYGAFFAVPLIALFVYLSVFVSYFYFFPEGGKADPMIDAFRTPEIESLVFPAPGIANALHFLPELHKTMVYANSDPSISKHVLQAPTPLSWPVAKSVIVFWANADKSRQVVMSGNALLWVSVFFFFLFEAAWVLWHLVKKKCWPFERDETVLLAGYAMNYLPFFFIHRPMHLYHYFTALLFLFLIAPKIAPRVVDCIGKLAKDRAFAYALSCFILVCIILSFFASAAKTYGL